MREKSNEELVRLAETWLDTHHLPHEDHAMMKELADRIRELDRRIFQAPQLGFGLSPTAHAVVHAIALTQESHE